VTIRVRPLLLVEVDDGRYDLYRASGSGWKLLLRGLRAIET
jgi:hypothetical protein